MWLLSSVANYRLTGNLKSRRRGLHVATVLAGRFNSNGNFIRAWNSKWFDNDSTGWAIIDCMMNIPLLHWASKELNDPRFSQIAMKHADTVMKNFIRPDGSVKHIVEFNPQTGEYIKNYTGQGYSEESSWTRGQSWALYGFALSYIHTGKQEYLDTAKKTAHYFIASLQNDFVPPCDFRGPQEPVYKDTTAGMCAACGLIEISKVVPEFEKELYLEAAIKILKATEKYCDWSDSEDSIVQMGTEAFHFGAKNIPIIYGDYYFIEAISKLRGNHLLLW
jgi:unsaturated chondroitin disaccharide hydrolase